MQLAIEVLVFVTGFLSSLALLQYIFSKKLAMVERLATFTKKTGPKTYEEEKLSASFRERVIKPLLSRLARRFSSAVPTKKSVGLAKRLQLAGNPGDLSPGEFLVVQYSLMSGLMLVMLLVTLASGTDMMLTLSVSAGAAIAGFLLPSFYLKSKTSGRKQEIQNSLPDVLDLLTVSVEAGLGFDAALVKVVDKTKGVLADEFNRMLQEIKMGKPRRESLRDLAQNTGNEDLQSFISALIQADQLGISIGNVLRIQSEQMRGKRRQVAEEKAMKAPIKMLIPMIFFIFPTMFIVLMGPAAIELLNTMGK